MRKTFTLFLLIFVIAICAGCENGMHMTSHANYYYEEISNIEEELPTIVYITATGTKYHQEYCHYLKYTKCRTFLEDAIGSGYKHCSACNT